MALTASSRTRLWAGMAAVVLASAAPVLTAAFGAGVVQPSPFTPLEGLSGVSFSNDRYAVSLHWPAAAYSLELPGLPLHRSGPLPVGTELRIGCRADNGRPGYGVAPADVVLELRRHPDARGTYAPFDAVLETPRVYDLGGRLPMWVAGLPAGHVLSLVARSSALDLRAEGSGTVVSARFAPDGGLAPAAEAMLRIARPRELAALPDRHVSKVRSTTAEPTESPNALMAVRKRSSSQSTERISATYSTGRPTAPSTMTSVTSPASDILAASDRRQRRGDPHDHLLRHA